VIYVTTSIPPSRGISLASRMREDMIGSGADAVVAIGGRTLAERPSPGVEEEIDLARVAGMPAYLLGAVRGQTAVRAQRERATAPPWSGLGNPLSAEENERLRVEDGAHARRQQALDLRSGVPQLEAHDGLGGQRRMKLPCAMLGLAKQGKEVRPQRRLVAESRLHQQRSCTTGIAQQVGDASHDRLVFRVGHDRDGEARLQAAKTGDARRRLRHHPPLPRQPVERRASFAPREDAIQACEAFLVDVRVDLRDGRAKRFGLCRVGHAAPVLVTKAPDDRRPAEQRAPIPRPALRAVKHRRALPRRW
jgi:hypothetical protein